MLVKTECIRGRVFPTRADANLALFEYFDGFYNTRRIQKRLGYLSPIEYEEKHYADQATAETSEPETPPTPPGQLISTSHAPGEAHGGEALITRDCRRISDRPLPGARIRRPVMSSASSGLGLPVADSHCAEHIC
jgi:hypothetical protein